jgi:hypothetical protein
VGIIKAPEARLLKVSRNSDARTQMLQMAPLLSVSEAALLLNLHPGTLNNWRSKGRGPDFVKIGSTIGYEPDAIAAFKEAHTRTCERSRRVAEAA